MQSRVTGKLTAAPAVEWIETIEKKTTTHSHEEEDTIEWLIVAWLLTKAQLCYCFVAANG